ncbi:MAG: CHAT domain-containing tetratricopeptide repeat protein [Bacteroidota bacterium]
MKHSVWLILVSPLLCSHLFSQQADSLLAESLFLTGSKVYEQGYLDSALVYLDSSVQLFSSLEVPPYSYLSSKKLIVALLVKQGEFDLATKTNLAFLEEAKNLAAPEDEIFFHIYNHQSNIYHQLYNREQRDVYLNKILAWFEQKDSSNIDPILYASFLHDLAITLIDKGDFHRGISYYTQVIDILHDSLDHDINAVASTIDAYRDLAILYTDFNEDSLALDYYQKGDQLIKKNPSLDRSTIAYLYYNWANFYRKIRDFDRSIPFSKKILQEYDESVSTPDDQSIRIRTLFVLGQTYIDKRAFGKADPILKQAIKENKALENSFFGHERDPFLGIILFQLARSLRNQGRFPEALQTYQQALFQVCHSFADTVTHNNPPIEDLKIEIYWMPLLLKAKAETQIKIAQKSQSLDDWKANLRTYQLLLSLLDRDKKNLVDEKSKIYMLGKTYPAFEGATYVALQLFKKTEQASYVEQAFLFAEKSKSALLLAKLQDATAQSVAGIPDSILTKEQEMQRTCNNLRGKIFAEKIHKTFPDSVLVQYRKELFELEEELANMKAGMEEEYPIYFHTRYANRFASIQEIQQQLAHSKTAIIEYVWGGSGAFAIGISDSAVSFRRISPETFSARILERVLSQIHQADSSYTWNLREELFELHQALIQPTLEELGSSIDHLIIIPDGQLGYLPFDILLREQNQQEPKYLIKDYSISYANSASLLFLEKEFQHPTYSFAGFGPRYSHELILPYTQTEVDQLQEMMDGEIFVNEQATKQNFLEKGIHSKILHLAMHGFPNDQEPLLSSLLFQSDSSRKGESLFAYELYTVSLAAELAVLSACHTGYGPVAKGEGIRSIARSFQYAGCPSVVMSLWEANGLVAKDLMPLFYGYLKAGHRKDVALQQAKIDFLDSAPTQLLHPQMWANFVLIGDPGPLSKETHNWWIWGLLLLLGCVLLFWVYRILQPNDGSLSSRI